ncbi:hypothetical protein DDZ14_07810 [Maritimibacter sp. 55A14]|uniref:tetratricopeptide repeat protein n=1 Tax=Maritimibacter sp. 55A14 TaxID=2174844 RepID=UPI000D610E8D|nr:tetratricopeptide repeat protein [Maritimibacter sp. 55A14]PWE32986.1 hypothetical protein DDZ14_07810 [Maritimibacter sp. 55A14]
MTRMTKLAATLKRLLLVTALMLGVGLLSACESAEERAEKHFQTGMALLEEGDVERALVEFRNVFKLNGQHKEARLAYARVERERGNVQEAYSQYLRLVEQYPDNLEGRRALAQMALRTGNWEEVERHGKAAAEIDPDDTLVQSINNTAAYFRAARDRDAKGRAAGAEKALVLLEDNPGLYSAWQVRIDDAIRAEDWTRALTDIDAAFANVEGGERESLYSLRLGVLQELGDVAAIEAQLEEMLVEFPDDPGVKQLLVRVYVSQDKIDDAEAFLRSEADPEAEDTAPVEQLLSFLETFRGREAAIGELDMIIAGGGPNEPLFRALRAKLNFNAGNEQDAIAEMEAILEGAERTQTTRQIEVDLARMLFRSGNAVGARALVEQVLAEDRSNVGAIKLKAHWLIEDDKTGDAIILLRTGLGQAPRDPELLTLMARAHERDGNRRLMGEMLALAVEASRNAPDTSLRYAAHLVQEESYLTAEGVLIDALRLAPANTDLLAALGNVYIEMQDWGRIDSVVSSLEGIGSAEANVISKELTARRLAAQNRTEELTDFLDELSRDPELGSGAGIALIRTLLARGDVEGALTRVESLLADDPGNAGLRFVRAFALSVDGQTEAADEVYQNLNDEFPENEQFWMARYRLHTAEGNPDRAQKVLQDGLTRLPKSLNLQWALAGELQKVGDIEGAIAVYEQLYEQNSNSAVIANNLASLLSTHRDEPEALERAYLIAKRLRGSDVPQFQDTFGWIAHRMGDNDAALNHLLPASEGMPGDPAVRYHLARTYAALEQDAAALETYRKVIELVDPANPPEFMAEVEAEVARLSAPAEGATATE